MTAVRYVELAQAARPTTILLTAPAAWNGLCAAVGRWRR